ncbi:toll/interleukin-1 receptor domain-containing protein [Agriterribacter sp.]|uniref:toll/interleukin-1 receptor domain-containing protein n=1 Tax=Agriterribacter sp. TaxID=2821509 RepID=UPI002CCDDAC3|nr:toll/interleukin-1 receptor domain-containing protein [Agriterribacter sp.]HTN06489.1 toll/interleukin-1 receptor domain-containing protein [Agriterribacter sp.]
MRLKKIFFSYSRDDGSDFALQLALDLKKEGFHVWIDQQDIRAGSEWDLEIEKALETCDCLLFIETEKSVSSNNVLDEVYYALGQQKKVIPVILRDSKTPFRLQRLQHVDFTKDYNTGLAHLLSELKDSAATVFFQPGAREGQQKIAIPFFTKASSLILIITFFVIAIAAVVMYSAKNKKAVKLDTGYKTGNNSEKRIANLNETFEGDWQLVDVEPGAASQSGYLKIEDLDGEQVKIKSYVQFYYIKTNDTAFLSIFNGFAGCTSCVLQEEMKIIAEDIAIATQRYEILKQDQPDAGKAGDTVMNTGSNTSIRASVALHLRDAATIVIKVQRTTPAELSYGMVLEPFVYSFYFRKVN